MTLRQYVFVMLVGTALCWAAWLLVTGYLNPTTAGWLGFALFYASFSLALVGTFAVTGLGLRLVLLKREAAFRQVVIAFRQALSFAALVVSALLLQSQDLLTWWNVLLLVATLTFVEFAVLTLRRRGDPYG